MGLLDAVVGALGAGGGGGQPDLMKIVMSLVQQAGGIEGLMAKLQQGGLAEAGRLLGLDRAEPGGVAVAARRRAGRRPAGHAGAAVRHGPGRPGRPAVADAAAG
jgi:hypothetical protein